MEKVQKINPFLWFDNQAEEASKFYVSIFKNSRINKIVHYGTAGPGLEGSVMTVAFELEGHEFTALNGGPVYKFTEAVSFVVNCDSQDEVDYYWDKLTDGGEEGVCGWLKDKYGLSRQIVPTVMVEMMSDPDPEKAKRVTEAMLKMVKIDIKTLEMAYNG
jgi:predicted 3-demethylubiquinone-9 3-methyltransferase (glyoxalase superfamily)